MSKQSLLLVDGDTRSLRVLEVSLRKAGFTVTTAETVSDALEKLALHAPDLIVSETVFADGDGFELRRRVRAMPERVDIPFIFLTAEQAIENKIRGLELGVDDYLTKPIYIKEIITRVNILLQKRQRTRFEERRDGRTRFAGRVSDMPVVDVIQTIEISRKSGVIQFVGDRGNQATIYFRDGKVIDAEAGKLVAEDAVYRLLTWNDGEFEVVFRTVRRRDVITTSSQGMLMEGMRRLDEWSRLLEQMPPLTHRFEVDATELVMRLGEVPDDNNRILRLLDGKRTVLEVIDGSDVGDLECLQAIARLYFEELLVDLDQGATPRRDSRPHPAIEAVIATPIEEVASGPHARTVSKASLVADQAGPLMGGYRPSGLRLIDEAVAAAQAIDSTLFDGHDEDSQPFHRETPTAFELPPYSGPRSESRAERQDDAHIERDDLAEIARLADAIPRAVPEEIEDEPAERSVSARTVTGTLLMGAVEDPAARREDLRMIGSHGADRAEASGELRPIRAESPPAGETQRELVTILPRRITREMPLPVTAGTPASVVVSAPAVVVEPPRPIAVSREATGTHLRRSSGPGPGAIVLLALAAILTGVAIYLRVHKHHHGGMDAGIEDARTIAVGELDASVVAIPPIDAATRSSRDAGRDALLAVTPPDAPVDARPAPVDARPDAAVPVDARPDAAVPVDARLDAAVPVDARAAAAPVDARAPASVQDAGGVDAGPSIAQRAKELTAAAETAMADSQFEKALELVDRSIKLRRTEATYLVRATVLQRLARVDDAIDSVDSAIDIATRSGRKLPFAWKQRGLILWSARRRDDARKSLEKFLELQPTGKDADDVRKLLETP